MTLVFRLKRDAVNFMGGSVFPCLQHSNLLQLRSFFEKTSHNLLTIIIPPPTTDHRTSSTGSTVAYIMLYRYVVAYKNYL
jgi:hypothetical protein